MPAQYESIGKGKYKVSTPNGVHAYGTSLENAQKQTRLLNAIEFNKKFKPRKKILNNLA